MARISNARLLDVGDTFPALDLTLTNGERFALPSSFTQAYNLVLVNRGAWCPYCSAQLSAFQAQASAFDREGIGIVSFSADSLDSARSLVAKHGLSFPVGYGASVETIAQVLGAYYDPKPTHTTPYLQSTGFVLGPGAKVRVAVYSSGAIGRLVPQDVLGFVRYDRAHA